MRTRTIHVIAIVMLFTTAFIVQAQTLTTLYSFKNSPDGSFPTGTLIRDAAGNLYGTTQGGGGGSCQNGFIYGCGVVFKVDSAGKETLLHSFTGPDGANPYAGLLADTQGNFYGITANDSTLFGGTIFKIDTGGKFVVLYNFSSNGSEGAYPIASLIRDSAGNLYGTASAGGGFSCGPGCGTVFKFAAGKAKASYLFGLPDDGAAPLGSLVRDAAGNLYGTASAWGDGSGTVFKLDKKGTETVIYSFKGGKDGSTPWAGLLRDPATGAMYGTTNASGEANNGTVYKIDVNGKETVLYSFKGGTDGGNPGYGTLIMDTSGNLYGTTLTGGVQNGNCVSGSCGTIFELKPGSRTWTETVLYRFTGGTDGASPYGGLIRDSAGNLYGTTSSYGLGSGTVFKLVP